MLRRGVGVGEGGAGLAGPTPAGAAAAVSPGAGAAAAASTGAGAAAGVPAVATLSWLSVIGGGLPSPPSMGVCQRRSALAVESRRQ
jgi:hypothetical protein